MVSRRDFVLASTYEKNEDESYNLVFTSIEDPKIKADSVRALVNIIIEIYFNRLISMVPDLHQLINLMNVKFQQ